MPLNPGQDLSHYRLAERIGEGGMGVVWRAADTTLGRDVALKVLPDLFAGDPERAARFEREARLLASLNHPHIASIYGLHVADGTRFLAMELVEGEDLTARIGRGAMPPEEALHIARQVADALEHAHEKGIIHRDLKPANVKLGSGGEVKVLDFGLAKAFEGGSGPATAANLSQSPTITGLMTGAHVILGTAPYMSPEQARGQAADKRSDIWAFGVLLFEMLTGRQLFQGETVSDTLASVLKSDPDWGALPRATPARIRTLLRRCLERDPRRRLRDIGEARILIDEVTSGAPEEIPAAALEAESRPRAPAPLTIAAGALVGVGLGLLVASILARPKAEIPLRRFVVATADEEGHSPQSPVISPDGRMIAYLRGEKLWIQPLDDLEPRELSAAANPARPFWSPDSRFVGYVAGTRVMKTLVDGGETQTICDLRASFTGGSGADWTTGGTIVCSRAENDGMFEASALGGDPRSLMVPDSTRESDFHDPATLPGNKGVIYVVHRRQGIDTIELLSKGKRKVLVQLKGQTLGDPCYSPTGHVLFRRSPTNRGVWAVPFSLSHLDVTGKPFLVAPDGSRPTVAADGTLSYLAGDLGASTQLVWIDRNGREAGAVGGPENGMFFAPALSPDGRQIAVSQRQKGDTYDLWIYDTARGTKTRLTFDIGDESGPAWFPSGDRVAYQARAKDCRGGGCWHVLTRRADGSGAPDTLGQGVLPTVSPDGRYVVWSIFSGSRADLAAVPVGGSRAPLSVVQDKDQQFGGCVSPGGGYVAYTSDESGRYEVFLKRFPAGGAKWQVSADGGSWPRWNRAGTRLYYVSGDDVMEVEMNLTAGRSPRLGTPRKLFTRQPVGGQVFGILQPAFDVSGDGERFVAFRSVASNNRAQSVTVVQNWIAEFEKRK